VQQALLNAWTALRAGTEVREMRSWLYRITHNQAISALRRSGYDFEELSEAVSVSEDLDRGMLIRETLAAVAALPDLQREAIVRTAVDGRS
jgi:DNA-directed RNA polymerase specialized sigma24 family protein